METKIIERIDIRSLVPNEKNPRKIAKGQMDKLKKSILEFPDMLEIRPIIVDETLTVLAGNMRLRALLELEWEQVPYIQVNNLTEEQKKEFIVKDNLSYGEWEWDSLIADWDQELLLDWGLEIPTEFKRTVEGEDDDFDIEVPNETSIVLGDLIEIGPHKLLCGDTTVGDDWQKLMDGKLADLVLTDPPYNVAYDGGTDEKLTIQNDSMSDEDFYKFLYDSFLNMNLVTKKGGGWYVWHADKEVINFRKAMTDAGVLVKQGLVWNKNSMVMGRQDYQWKHEPCLYGWKEGAPHNWYSDRKQTTILEFDRPVRNAEHPTMKPIPLFSYQINNSSRNGDIVIDGFLGSGSAMVAAHQLGRICYGIELDPKYCQVIVHRMKNLDPSLEIKINGVVI